MNIRCTQFFLLLFTNALKRLWQHIELNNYINLLFLVPRCWSKNFVSNLALFQIQVKVLNSLQDPMLLKLTNDTPKHFVVKPLENIRSSCAKGNPFSCSFLNTSYFVMVTTYYKLQKGNLESLNPYIYIAVKEILNSFSGKCNEYQEKKQSILEWFIW